MTYHGTICNDEPKYDVSTEKGEQGWKVRFQCVNTPDPPVWVGVPFSEAKTPWSAMDYACKLFDKLMPREELCLFSK